MNIRFEVINRKNKNYDHIKVLYRNAFPKSEQFPFWYIMWKAKKEFVDFLSIYDGDKWIGVIYLITDNSLTFVLYFAIDDKVRAKGYGSEIMSAIKKKYVSNRIILDIEQPNPKADNNEQRIRRKQFYQKNGYRETEYYFEDGDVDYEMLITGEDTVMQEECFQLFKKFAGPFFLLLEPLGIIKIKIKTSN